MFIHCVPGYTGDGRQKKRSGYSAFPGIDVSTSTSAERQLLSPTLSANGSSAVRHRSEGIVVSPGDSDALRAAIERLCHEPALSIQMA